MSNLTFELNNTVRTNSNLCGDVCPGNMLIFIGTWLAVFLVIIILIGGIIYLIRFNKTNNKKNEKNN